MEVIATDSILEGAVEAILRAAYTGRMGDGEIYISSIERAMHIRTGETESDAACQLIEPRLRAVKRAR